MIVGREREFDQLAAHTDHVRAGLARLVVVTGAAGTGRTVVLDTLRRRLAADFTVLRAACRPSSATRHRGTVHALLAPLGHHPGPADAGDDTHEALHAPYRRVSQLMRHRPLALVIDDAQWCDAASLRWLDFLLRRTTRGPLLVVLGWHDAVRAPADPVLTRLLRGPGAAGLPLPPLTEPAVAELVREAFDGPGTPSFVRRCHDLTGGNPALLRRLLDELHTAGITPDDRDAHRVTELGAEVRRRSALIRLDTLPDHVRVVARALAVLEDPGPGATPGIGLVAALAGVPEHVASHAMTALARAGLVTGGRFTHTTGRLAVLTAHPADELPRLRDRAARLLNDAGRPAEEVALRLLERNGPLEPWMTGVFREAADAARRRGAPEDAASYLARVLAAGGPLTPPVQLRIELARPLAQVDPAAALAHLAPALAGTTGARDRASLAVQVGLTAVSAQRAPEGTRVLADARAELIAAVGDNPGPTDRELRAQVESTLLLTGIQEASTLAETRALARSIPAPPGRTPGERQLLGVLAALDAGGGTDLPRSLDLAERAVRVPEGTGDWALVSATFALHLADELPTALTVLDRLTDPARRRTHSGTLSVALANRAHVLFAAGRVRDAVADARDAAEAAARNPRRTRAAWPNTMLAVTLVAHGDLPGAERALLLARRPGADRVVWNHPYHLLARGRARWQSGDTEGALHHLRRCGDHLDRTGITNPLFATWWVDATAILVELGRRTEAGELAHRQHERALRWGAPRAIGLGLTALGLAESGRRAVALLSDAVDLLATSPARLCLANARFRLGEALLRVGRNRQAREHLRAALDLSTQCGSQALFLAASRRHAAAGGRRRSTGPAAVDLLTGAERRVAALASAGHTNREIADALFVTVRTVEVHLTNTYRKLDVPGRAALRAVLPEPDPTGQHR
ncbi:helix-turn-helix transcriptional regulator [Actinoalloteichus caeruleus]|uniref:helix-turn-helix transcriptional regulator n=1 Tax=Actinoalloteichus cyanogriseus TaxID=2893586 RepID=UPI000411142A|nr:helix-turn-helix transcriptional regulator [Actinoalloteichus caeruleus]